MHMAHEFVVLTVLNAAFACCNTQEKCKVKHPLTVNEKIMQHVYRHGTLTKGKG